MIIGFGYYVIFVLANFLVIESLYQCCIYRTTREMVDEKN